LWSAERGLSCEERLEIVVRDRIPEFLSEEVLLDQHVDGGRQRARTVPPLEQSDGMRVLLPAKDQLCFLFALDHLLPHRHGDGHRDGHHREANE
jgi:hypothetical protein